jgi:muconolactone delta-isomerase
MRARVMVLSPSSSSKGAFVNPFMVVCTFKPGTDMTQVGAVVAEEQAKAQELQDAGRVTGIHLAIPRGTVFLQISAADAASAEATVKELPMSKFWDLDVFPLVLPAH